MKLSVVTSFAILFNACTSPHQPRHEFNLMAVQNIIEQANNNYGQRFTNGDIEFYKKLYVNDACIMPDNIEKICGVEAIRDFNYDSGNNKDLKIFSEADDVFGGPNEVVEVGHFEIRYEDDALFRKGKFIAIWVQDEKMWKLKYEIWNLDQ